MSNTFINSYRLGVPGFGSCDQFAFENSGFGSTSISTTFQVGWQFLVGSNNLQVCALRANFPSARTETVRLWRVSDQVLVASASVTVVNAGGGWGETSITPVELSAGANYIVTTRMSDGSSRLANRTTAKTESSHVSFVEANAVDGDGFPGASAFDGTYLTDAKFSVAV